MKIKKGILDRKIERVSEIANIKLELEHRGGAGYFLTRDSYSKTLIGGVSKKEVWDWLDAFEEGYVWAHYIRAKNRGIGSQPETKGNNPE